MKHGKSRAEQSVGGTGSLMGTVKEGLRQLFADRAAALTRIQQIDREIADVRAAVAAPLDAPAPPARAAHGVAKPAGAVPQARAGRKAPAPSSKRHDREAAREQCRKDILALLATGSRAMQNVAAALSWPTHVVREELAELKHRGAVTRTGTIGRNVRWALASPSSRGPRAGWDEQFETVWPLKVDPRKPPSALRANA